MENVPKEVIGGAPAHMTDDPVRKLHAKLDALNSATERLERLLSALISVHPDKDAIVKKAKEDPAR